MHTNEWSFTTGYCKLKTARQKKRLQKKDADKQLLQLDRLQDTLLLQKRTLPWVPLAEPYQKGWKRSFILREDVARSAQAEFYETLLAKINTVEYAPDKAFMRKKKGRKKKGREVRPQYLRSFCLREWRHPDNKLSPVEKALFYPKEFRSKDGKTMHTRFVYAEPWRFVLRVRPHMITEVRMVDEVLEQQLQYISNHIDHHHLQPRMLKLTRGRNWKCKWHFSDIQKYKNPLKNKPLHTILELVYNDTI